MKKILSVAMAAAMVASMSAMASAKVTTLGQEAMELKSDSTLEKYTGVPYGKTMYFTINDENSKMVHDSDEVKSVSIKQKWEMNGSMVEKVEIVKKKVAESTTGYVTGQKYYYFVALTTKSNNTTKANDLIGTVTLRKSGTDLGFEESINVNVELVHNPGSDFTVTKTASVFDFGAGDTEQEIRFAEHDNDYFIVDTCDQDDLLISVDGKYNSDIAAKYPEANLHFFNGNGATFNRIGELTLSDCDMGAKFVYELKDGVLVAVKAEFDEYEEAFKVKTRTIGTYVLSDVELKAVATEDNNSSSSDNNSKPNPGTGAIA